MYEKPVTRILHVLYLYTSIYIYVACVKFDWRKQDAQHDGKHTKVYPGLDQ